jgi:hypothetical protein
MNEHRELVRDDTDLAEEVKRLQRELARGEQRFANDQVRRLRETGYCPCCGAEERSGKRW